MSLRITTLDHPEVLYAVELPKQSGRWHPLDHAAVADALRAAGYTVRPYVPLVDLHEATGKRKFIRAAANHGPLRITEGQAQQAVRGFLLKASEEIRGA